MLGVGHHALRWRAAAEKKKKGKREITNIHISCGTSVFMRSGASSLSLQATAGTIDHRFRRSALRSVDPGSG